MKDKDWKSELTKEQYEVLRNKGTEAPFTGKYLENDEKGIYSCAACGNKLFDSSSKYESKTPGLIGWPSFQEVIDEGSIILKQDNRHGMVRQEVVCANCGSHLGHLFDDELSPNGKHFCINSISLEFES